MLWCLLSIVWADPGSLVEGRLAETAELRTLRDIDGVPTLTPEEWQEVVGGGIAVKVVAVPGQEARKTYGAGVLGQPIDRVWGAISDEAMQPAHTALEYAEIVKGRPCESGRHVFQYLDVGVPMIQDRWWVTIRRHNDSLHAASSGKVRELTWVNDPDPQISGPEIDPRRAAGIAVGFTKGAWYLTELDGGHTLVEYYSWVDPGGRLDPRMMAWFAGKTVRKTLESMERIAADPRVGCTGRF